MCTPKVYDLLLVLFLDDFPRAEKISATVRMFIIVSLFMSRKVKPSGCSQAERMSDNLLKMCETLFHNVLKTSSLEMFGSVKECRELFRTF